MIRFLGYDRRPPAKGIAPALKRYRQVRRVLKEDLAVTLGVDPSALARWECDERTPTDPYLTRMKIVLELQAL